MFGIRNNIVVSIMVHTLLFAAAFIAGSSELRSTRIVVSLVEEWGSGIAGQREQPPAQHLPQKTHGKEVESRNLAYQGASPVMSRSTDQTVPAAERMLQQSVPSENKDAGPEDSSVHMTGSPAAGRTGSLAGSDTNVVSQHNSAGGIHSAPVAAGGARCSS